MSNRTACLVFILNNAIMVVTIISMLRLIEAVLVGGLVLVEID